MYCLLFPDIDERSTNPFQNGTLSLFSHYRHEGHENYRQPKKLLIVKQMFFVSTLGNV